MLGTIGKTVMAGAVMTLGLGFGVNKAAADSFSVSVHTPTVSAGYSNHHGHDGGYVAVRPSPPPVAYCPPPAPVVARPAWGQVVVQQPVVVMQPRHVCSWDRVPVTRVGYDECGRRIYYTEYVKVRTCDDYHRRHDHAYYGYPNKHGHGHYKHYDDHDHHKHGKHHDDDYRYSRNWDDDDRDHDHDRHDNHRGRDRD